MYKLLLTYVYYQNFLKYYLTESKTFTHSTYFKQRTGESLGLVGGHGPEVPQIRLVSDEHDDYVVVGVVPQFLQPPLHVLVGQVLGDVVHQQSPDRPAVVPAQVVSKFA